MARAKHKMAKLWMLKSGGDKVNYMFPRTKFVDETPLDKQLEHNDKRGYYEDIPVLVEAAKEREKWKMENCYKNNAECRTCCSGGIMLGSFCKEGRELFEAIGAVKP